MKYVPEGRFKIPFKRFKSKIMMNVGFVGLGKLGLPCALAIESKGHNVLGNDISPRVARIIKTRKLPYKENGAQQLLQKSKIRLTSLTELVKFADLIFVAVQTPHEPKYEGVTRLPKERKDFDYDPLKKAVGDLAEAIEQYGKPQIVIIVSTVLPGTIEREIKPLLNRYVKLCYNPALPAMGTVIQDYLNPEFVLFGVDDQEALETAKKFYQTIVNAPFYECSIREAECIKVFYNTFITTKIGFSNTVMEVCEKINADCDVVMDGLFLGTKRIISPMYMRGGMGDGGPCHPRDNIALSYLAKKLDLSFDWFESIMKARENQTEWLAKMVQRYHETSRLPIVILGKTFKPETNLTVGSPAILLRNILEENGCNVEIYDPYLDNIPQFKTPSIFFIATKHDQFKSTDYPVNSIVIDPWRYIPKQEGVTMKRIGENR